MSNKESLTLKEKLYRLAAVGALGSVALTGCATNVDATPTSTSQSESPSTPSASPTESAPKPSPSETEVAPSNIIVDYSSFSDWSSKPEGLTPAQSHKTEGSREYTCDTFFSANGVTSWEDSKPEAGWKGEQITEYLQPRLELAWQLNLDESNSENSIVAKHILECITSRTDSNDANDAYYMLSNIFDTGRLSSLEIPSPSIDIEKITRESSGGWYNGSFNAYVTEYETKNSIGDTVYPKITFEASQYGDYRLSSINNLSGGEDTIVWGTQPPVIKDQTRVNAPYATQ